MHRYTFRGRTYNFSRPLPTYYAFETWIDANTHLEWMKRHWHYSLYISTVYLVMVFLLRRYMESRPPLDIPKSMAAWNATFALYSTVCVFRGIDVLIGCLTELKTHTLVCDTILIHYIPRITFWGTMFLYSKVLELGDTVLIVLAKRKLLFLHCFHHAATLVLAWYMTAKEIAILAYMGYVNVIVHSLMYSYFAFKSLGFKIPPFVAVTITVIQLTQMLLGVLLSVIAYVLMGREKQCDISPGPLEYAFCLYFVYALLFCHLFYTSYVKPNLSRKKTE